MEQSIFKGDGKMNTRKLLFYLSAVLLGGCVPVISLHPLFTEEQVVFDEKLLGTWVDDPNDPDTTWQFTRSDKRKNAYLLVFSDDNGKKGSFIAHLVKLEGRLFLDAYPSEVPWEPEDPEKVRWPYNSLFLIPTHTFAKIESIGPQLKMRITNEDDVKKLLKEHPDSVKHTAIEDRVVLTASTKDLQAFVLKYADDDIVFTNEIVLERKEGK